MFLPHQILGSLFAAGKMDLIVGNEVPCFNVCNRNHEITAHNSKEQCSVKHVGEFGTTLMPSKVLSRYWNDLAHTSWFKSHPVLSASWPPKNIAPMLATTLIAGSWWWLSILILLFDIDVE